MVAFSTLSAGEPKFRLNIAEVELSALNG